MIICSYTFRWADYKTPADAELTARWFAAWVRLRQPIVKGHLSDEGIVVPVEQREEYSDFVRSLRARAERGEKLPPVETIACQKI